MDPIFLAYVVPLGVIWVVYIGLSRRADGRNRKVLEVAHQSGLAEPASLHPVIDNRICVGCGACVRACPEGRILGLVGGRARLIEPSSCIGHGACQVACPVGAITLVLGTAARGVDIPHVNADFETNVPGIFVAGELGGMGLIRNAIEQGKQAIDAIRKRGRSRDPAMLDVVIVGAGPAGIAATLAATERGLRYLTIEQDVLGGTIAHFPRSKLVMTAPAMLPIAGRMAFREVSKEQLLRFLLDAAHKASLRVRTEERLEGVEPDGDGFTLRTNRGVHRARAVLLAIGRRGTPRRLDVEGEDLAKVVYRLVDAEQYRNRHVLVVGGGDSALEAAASVADESGATVTLSYRSAAFARAKPKNRQRVEAAARDGRLSLLLPSTVRRINEDSVELEHDGRLIALANDTVIVCAGGILPTPLLKSMGIEIETRHGAP